MIDFLKEVKSKIDKNLYKTGKEIKKDFYKIINNIWDSLSDDLYKEDLTNLYEMEHFLINQVVKIHDKENSKINSSLLKENINIRKTINLMEDGKKAYNIYSLNGDYIYYLIGDIHSDTISLDKILEKSDFFNKVQENENIRLIFIGDYVDRGKRHLKAINYILQLKYLFPDNIKLLQGNHDGGSFNNNEVKMWVRKPEKDNLDDWFLLYLDNLTNKNETLPRDFISDFINLFESLGNLAFIFQDNNIFMLSHGGIPRYSNDKNNYYNYIKSISDLQNENIKDVLDNTIIHNMIWSDPSITGKDLREDSGRFSFTKEHFEAFRKYIDFDYFIRGHEGKEEGYEKIFDNHFITVFSSGRIMENEINVNDETAYEWINPKILELKKGNIEIIGLN